MGGLLLNFCYLSLLALAGPFVAVQRLRAGKSLRSWGRKLLGLTPIPPCSGKPVVWLHAVSVGEVLQLRQVVEGLRSRAPEVQLFISTTTETGYAVACETFPDCVVGYYPLDFTWSVRRALQRVRPALIVLIELELWPNFILEASRRGIPIALVNGRLSEKSFRGYSRIRPVMRTLLSRLSLIAAQAEEHRRRFLDLGADPARTIVTGSIKFDGVETNRDNPRTRELGTWLTSQSVPAIGRPGSDREGGPASVETARAGDSLVFIAGSTQAPEEALALATYRSLLSRFPRLRLIIVPRHPERGDEVAALIRGAGFAVQRRSQRLLPGAAPREGRAFAAGGGEEFPPVALLDTVGELGACWGLADVAFVGGSFTDRGGQNMLEPAAYGAAVCFGPNTWNFRQIVELLLARDAAAMVQNGAELTAFVEAALSQQAAAQSRGARARALVLEQRGATERTVEATLALLKVRHAGPASRRAA